MWSVSLISLYFMCEISQLEDTSNKEIKKCTKKPKLKSRNVTTRIKTAIPSSCPSPKAWDGIYVTPWAKGIGRRLINTWMVSFVRSKIRGRVKVDSEKSSHSSSQQQHGSSSSVADIPGGLTWRKCIWLCLLTLYEPVLLYESDYFKDHITEWYRPNF